MDFRKNYLKFSDPDFDGDVEIVEGGTDMPLRAKKKKKREVFRINGVNVEIAGKQVLYLDENMHLVKETNVEECVKNNILDHYSEYVEFQKSWRESTEKRLLAYELLLNETVAKKLMQDFGIPCDYYDLIGFYGYGVPIPLKEDRINRALSYVARLPKGQKDVMEIVIDVYRTTDWTDLRLVKIFGLPPFAARGYTIKTALKPFGGKEGYEKVIDDMEETLL